MESCKDPQAGKLIGSYELRLLCEKERRRFETHLLRCDACFRELYDMVPVARRLRKGSILPDRRTRWKARRRLWWWPRRS